MFSHILFTQCVNEGISHPHLTKYIISYNVMVFSHIHVQKLIWSLTCKPLAPDLGGTERAIDRKSLGGS